MFISPELLKSSLRPFNIDLSTIQIEMLDKYAKMLVDYNQKVNLTAITDPDAIVIKHFVDSLSLLNCLNIPENICFADVGTGAGLPGITLMIARPDIRGVLFDSTKKKLIFVQNVIDELSLNGKTAHMRAEEAGRSAYRESFDIVTARAVAQLRMLAELCLPLVKTNGLFCPMKGSHGNDERAAGETAIKKLGGAIEKEIIYTIPPEDRRTIIIIKKISQTSPKYPRSFAHISKNPL